MMLVMHCDDKRTIFALKQCILDSELELQKAVDELKTGKSINQLEIKMRIQVLEKTIQDSKDQLLSMK